jgi:hypothetical protein
MSGRGGAGNSAGAPAAGGSANAGSAPTAGNGGAAMAGADSGGSGPLPADLVWAKQGPNQVIQQIWGSGAGDIYAVGLNGVLLHSTGDGKWTTQTTGTSSNLTGVWGSGPTDVYVSVDSNFILHSVGDGVWEHQAYSSGFTFRGIWGLDAGHVFALGSGVARHLDAGGWQMPPEQVSSAPTLAFWASAPSDLYAATGMANNSTIYHSTGDGTWRAQTTPAATAAAAIVGVDATHLYASADNFVFGSSGNGTWTVQLTTATAEKVLALWAANPSALYACTQTGFIYTSNGRGKWSTGQDIDTAAKTICMTIWGTGPDDIYVAGSGGIYHGTQN